ncbi:MAG: TlpA family protein disulfide reductase [Gemmatimonadaceae bacterium]|nr:TlpA family protein disulfide reductase [Gemmatimonadaceae bacterium]
MSRPMFVLLSTLLSLAPFVLHAQGASSQSAALPFDGKWRATLHYDSLTVPFTLGWSRARSATPVIALYNGRDSITSTQVNVRGDSVTAQFEHLAAVLRGVRRGAGFQGWWVTPRRRDSVRVQAVARTAEATERSADAPSLNGTWILPVESSKGEKAWRLVVTQQGSQATATVLRVDGDAGAHVGEWRDGQFTLAHFDGTRPGVIELRPNTDGSLQVTQRGPRGAPRVYVAWRDGEAGARGLSKPTDVATHTSVRDSSVEFAFDFPALTGERLSNRDARFAGKVVVVNVTGTWCPNCHDEAPFLTALYNEYKNRGLEVVALDFEEQDELEDLARVKAFVSRYGVSYPYLIAGLPREVREKIPQAVNLDTWPATFFLDRQGRVREVRTGFAAKASGPHHDAMVADYRSIVEKLLAESR